MNETKIASFESIECNTCYYNPSETRAYFFDLSLVFIYENERLAVKTEYRVSNEFIWVLDEYGELTSYTLSDGAALQIVTYLEKRLSKRKIKFRQMIDGVVTDSPYPHFYAGVVENELKDAIALYPRGDWQSTNDLP